MNHQDEEKHERDEEQIITRSQLQRKSKNNRIPMLELEIAKATDPAVKADLKKLLEAEMEKDRKRKYLIIIGATVSLLLIANVFIINKWFDKKSEKSIVEKTTISSVSSSSSMTTKMSTSSRSSESSTEKNEEYNFAVSMSDLLDNTQFYFKGVNNPSSILLDLTNTGVGTVTFIRDRMGNSGTDDVVFSASVINVPTKQMRIFSKNGSSEIRNVKVNTEISLIEMIKGDEASFQYLQSGAPLYVFYDKEGKVSLITPNYAGNVATKEDTYIYQELSTGENLPSREINTKDLTEQQAIRWAEYHFYQSFGYNQPEVEVKTALNSSNEVVITFYNQTSGERSVITSYRINDQGFLMGHTLNLGHYVVAEYYDVPE